MHFTLIKIMVNLHFCVVLCSPENFNFIYLSKGDRKEEKSCKAKSGS